MQVLRGRTIGACISMLLVTACGGGSGDSAPVTSIPGGTPTPVPTPFPTATPTPAPPLAYDTAFDLGRDRNISLYGSELTAIGTDGSPSSTGFSYSSIAAALIDSVRNPTFGYNATSQQSNLTLSNLAPQIFDPAQISLRDVDRLVYTTPTGFFTFAQPGPGIGSIPAALKYTVLITQSDQSRNAVGNLEIRERRFVGGSRTVAADVPRTGSATYRVLLTSYAEAPGCSNGFVAQGAELSIDYATGAIRGTITANSTVSNVPVVTITVPFTGQVSTSSGRLNGSLSEADGGTGQFAGELLGPQGLELGAALVLSRGDQRIAGMIVGIRR